MKKKMIKCLSVLLVALIVISAAPLNNVMVDMLKNSTDSIIGNASDIFSKIGFALPDFSQKVSAAFITNKKEEPAEIDWSYKNGVLTLSGKGKMPSYQINEAGWTQYKDTCEKVVIKGYLKSIGNSAFKGFSKLKTIEVIGSLESFDANAFRECTSLDTIIFATSLKTIGSMAFYNCTSLENIVLPDGLTTIGSSAFAGCVNLKTITIPDSVTTIGGSPFAGCELLEGLRIPESLVKLGANAFKGFDCFDGADVVLPDTVTYVGIGAFNGCNIKSLTTPVIGAGPANEDSGRSDFIGYMFGTEEFEDTYKVSLSKVGYYIPNSLKEVTVTGELNEYNLYRAKSVEKLVIGDNVKSTFFPKLFAYGSQNLKEIVIGDLKHFEGVGAQAFQDCQLLESFAIPENVTWIGESAFKGCTNLKNIGFPSGDFYARKEAFEGTSYLTENTNEFIIEGDGVLVQYNGTDTSVVVPDNVKRISCAFYNRDDITDIKLPESLLYISIDSFRGCTKITELIIPDSVQKMNQGSLRGLCGLERLTLPFVGESREVYGRNWNSTIGYLFDQCPACKNMECYNRRFRFSQNSVYSYVSVPENFSEITINGGILREKCIGALGEIPKVNLGSNITLIDEYALANLDICSLNFSSVLNATEIRGGAFIGNKFTSITIPSGVKKLGRQIVSSNVNTIILNEGLEEIDSSFISTSITNINFPESLKRIQGDPFEGCKNLKILYIPENVEEIGELVIEYSNLQKVVVSEKNKNYFSEYGIVYTSEGELFAYPPQKNESVYKIGPRVSYINPIKLDKYNFNAFVVDVLNQHLKSVDGVLYNADVSAIIKYPNGKKADSYIAPDTVKCVESHAFYCNQNLKTVDLKNAIEFKEECFYSSNFEKLVVADLSDKLTKYFGESYEFNTSNEALCSNLKTLILTNQSSDIADYFAFKTPIENLTINGSFNVIGKEAFKRCQFRDLKLPDSVTIINDGAFSQCTMLENINLGSNLKTIGKEAFYGCPLKSVDFPKSLVTIDDWAFAFTQFEYVELSENIVNVGRCAFGGSDVKKAVVNEKIGDIAEEVFQNCTNLQIVVLGGNVEKISASAFENCSSLNTIVIPDNVMSIDQTAFTNANEDLVIYCNEDSYAQSYAKSNNIKYTTLVLSSIPNQVYTGSAIEPLITVCANGKELVQDSQYKLTFTDNVNVGTAKVVVRGSGDFKHLVAKGQFSILARMLSDVVVAYNEFGYYHPKGTKPNVSLYIGDRKLVEGEDYEILNLTSIKDVGVYNVSVKGINNLSGTHNFVFEVLPRSITVTKIENKGEIKVTDSSYTLVEDIDYKVEIRTDENGEAETFVVGMGNYTDEKSCKETQNDSFSILRLIMNMISNLLSSLFSIFK